MGWLNALNPFRGSALSPAAYERQRQAMPQTFFCKTNKHVRITLIRRFLSRLLIAAFGEIAFCCRPSCIILGSGQGFLFLPGVFDDFADGTTSRRDRGDGRHAHANESSLVLAACKPNNPGAVQSCANWWNLCAPCACTTFSMAILPQCL